MYRFQIFEKPEFGSICVWGIDYQPYFIGKEIAAVLGYPNTDKAVSEYVDDDYKFLMESYITDSQSGYTPTELEEILLINEPGLFSLIISSKSPSARNFKNWIISEVFPSLFRTCRPTGPDIEFY